jgi:putative RecB family exonuclease
MSETISEALRPGPEPAAPGLTASGLTAPGLTAPELTAPGLAEPDQPRGPSLSPSRAADFMACPLLYRFRVVDRLPEPPSPAAARGTLVHAVLERLFDEPAAGRTPAAARGLLPGQWDRLLTDEPELAAMFDDEEQRGAWFDEARLMLDRYFTLEDPTRLEPAHREMSVQALLESGLTLRGYIDRLDVAPTGEVRIVDYKTGTAPREEYEARALFQMKFYALALWRAGSAIPKMLQLIYLGNGEIVRYMPDEADLVATERKINALWQAIDRARSSGDWRPRPSRLCDWCSHRALCPAYGGTPPPLPSDGAAGPADLVPASAGPSPAVIEPAVIAPAVIAPAVIEPAVIAPAVIEPAVIAPAVIKPADIAPAVLDPAAVVPAQPGPAAI